MKTFTKILLAAGIIGAIGKFVNDHIVISVKKKEAEEKKPDPKIKVLYDEALDGVIGFDDPTEPDHIYYDNKYNACKIYKDENGCPWCFKFVHPGDAECAMFKIADDLLDTPDGKGVRFSLKNVFELWGLVINDYSEFAEWYVCWDRDEFLNANYENADPKIVSFGEFEIPKEEVK
jgi:hypothetical protein